MNLRRSEEALQDLDDIWDYLADKDPDAAIKLLRKIDNRVNLIKRYPSLGELDPRFGEGVRRVIVSPYLILYIVSEAEIVILRIYHSARQHKKLR